VVNVTDGADIYVRLSPLELGFCHLVLQDLLDVYSPGAVNRGFFLWGHGRFHARVLFALRLCDDFRRNV
jgi:hypothetical protein